MQEIAKVLLLGFGLVGGVHLLFLLIMIHELKKD